MKGGPKKKDSARAKARNDKVVFTQMMQDKSGIKVECDLREDFEVRKRQKVAEPSIQYYKSKPRQKQRAEPVYEMLSD